MNQQLHQANLNLDFYSGQDVYSDGEIEQEILEIVQRKQDLIEHLAQDTRWPVLYHLSPKRRNLLEWYPFAENASLLEIGAGCGALTGLFCEKVKAVTAVELSRRRAEIIQQRYQHDNLKIVVGNIQDIQFDQQFDYITLIGVLEYTRSFIQTDAPYPYFLSKIKSLLKPRGQLLVAIENKLGLKYFAGAPEDHTSKIFESIQGYPGTTTVETFGKQEITTLLAANGFPDIEFYYPYPDYKLPDVIYSDEYLPDVTALLMSAPNYDQEKIQLFNERLALLNIIQNNVFDIFSNSFLIVAKQVSK